MGALYQTGTFTSPYSLLTALDSYLTSVLGWTQNMAPVLISGKTAAYRAHYQRTIVKNGEQTTVYLNLASCGSASESPGTSTTEIPTGATKIGLYGYCSTGYSSALAWDRQTGYPVFSGTGYGIYQYMQLQASLSPACAYSFYGDAYGDFFVTAQYQSTSNHRSYLTCGVLDKARHGTWSGGAFFGGSKDATNTALVSPADTDTAIPVVMNAGGSYSYSSVNLLVYGTIDGVSGWISYSTFNNNAVRSGFTAVLFGQSNIGAGPIALSTSQQGPQTNSIPQVSGYDAPVSNPSGIIVGRDIELCVYRSTYTRYSPIGILPLVKLCPAVNYYSLPYGYSPADGSWILEENTMIELNNG